MGTSFYAQASCTGALIVRAGICPVTMWPASTFPSFPALPSIHKHGSSASNVSILQKKSGKFVSKATAGRMNVQRKAQMKQRTKLVAQNSSTASTSHTLATATSVKPVKLASLMIRCPFISKFGIT